MAYLLVWYPYYVSGTATGDSLGEGHWAAPFISRSIPIEQSPPETVGAVEELFRKYRNVKREREDVLRMADVLGLGDPKIERVGVITELKLSERTTWRVGCYKTIRYVCKIRSHESIRNLIDPECLKGHAFLPLEREARQRFLHRGDDDDSRVYFLGKPLISNLQRMLELDGHLDYLQRHATEISNGHLFLREKGAICLVDITGFGDACKLARERMPNFFQSGSEIARLFRTSLAEHFVKIASVSGITQSKSTGDGFLCAIPVRKPGYPSIGRRIASLLRHYVELLHTLDKMSALVATGNPEWKRSIGSRLALTFGEYRYGRIGGPMTLSPDFEGAIIIHCARMEGALKRMVYGRSSRDEPTYRHWIVIDSEYSNMIGADTVEAAGFRRIGTINSAEKEAQVAADVYALAAE
jgi:hypothetical protein